MTVTVTPGPAGLPRMVRLYYCNKPRLGQQLEIDALKLETTDVTRRDSAVNCESLELERAYQQLFQFVTASLPLL